MNPIYRFELFANGEMHRAVPVYGDGLAKDFELQSGQKFFRAKLSGKLTFTGDDFMFIVSQPFDTKFEIEISISYNNGAGWATYWRGMFWKTDMEFNLDDQTAIVQPETMDQYNDILAGMDKEYNLIDLAPEITPIKADKRPMIQIYVPGQSVIGCALSGMWWEQECTPEYDTSKLVNDFHFALNKTARSVNVSGNLSPNVAGVYGGVAPLNDTTGYQYSNGTYTFGFDVETVYQGVQLTWKIVRNSDNVVLWRYIYTGQPSEIPTVIYLQPVIGSGATGEATAIINDMPVYSRFVCDTSVVNGVATYNIPVDDIVPNNRNYSRVVGYYFPNTINFSTRLTSEPNQWGIYQPGLYYLPPYSGFGYEYSPVCRNAWNGLSIWFTPSVFDVLVEQSGRAPFLIRHAYSLASVISVLLEQIAPGIIHQPTADYSQFLYGGANVGEIEQTLFITPKSNIVSGGYDQPAQKAPITFKYITDMLRDCFCCYWFIDEQNRFRVEHILYFRNGGSYSGTPGIGIDLTTNIVPRNNKAWAYDRRQYTYDKPEMTARYQFGWMDNVTQLFDGYPIDILANYVNQEKIEQITVSQFTSDIDYILLNPGDVSKDGFVLLAAAIQSGQYVLPYMNYVVDGNDHYLQNAYVAFCVLQRYYAYDMPAPQYAINGQIYNAIGVRKMRTQTLRIPVYTDPDLMQLVKTNIGNGSFDKLSVNLSSRNGNATLKYDTE